MLAKEHKKGIFQRINAYKTATKSSNTKEKLAKDRHRDETERRLQNKAEKGSF